MVTISAGVEFDTPFEDGCVATGTPDQFGNFPARDSDGVVCTFNLQMVVDPDAALTPTMRYESAGVLRGGRVVWHTTLPQAA